jgi:hypothetical protein
LGRLLLGPGAGVLGRGGGLVVLLGRRWDVDLGVGDSDGGGAKGEEREKVAGFHGGGAVFEMGGGKMREEAGRIC